MSSAAALLPTLYALLPSDAHARAVARLSLLAIHIEPFLIRDTTYIASHPVVPGQQRILRCRHHQSHKGKGKARASPPTSSSDSAQGEEDREWELAYISQPLSGREYSAVSVRACVEVDVMGLNQETELDTFIRNLGFRRSHAVDRRGLLFHLPMSGMGNRTLHLSIAQVDLPENTAPASESDKTPWLVQLEPSRAVPTIPQPGEPTLPGMMRVLQDVAADLDWLEWGSGRS